MKIVTWNCGRGFAKKAERIFSGSPDIAVIQECSKKSTEVHGFEGYSGQWVGGVNLNIGMGVFHKSGWNLRPLVKTKESDPKWIVPFEVTGPENFTLIAVWACEVKGNKRESYVGQIHRALREHPGWFENGPIVIAGDFNSNAIFDRGRRGWNHTSMVGELKKFGLASAYHSLNKQEHGSEKEHTFYLNYKLEKPFHLDYIFAPEIWRERMRLEVGSHSDWLSLSDHCPLIMEISPASQELVTDSRKSFDS